MISKEDNRGALLFEEKHMIAIMLFLLDNVVSRKIDLYNGVSPNPRMPDKLDALEYHGMIVQDLDKISRSTLINLTEAGRQVAEHFRSVNRIVYGN